MAPDPGAGATLTVTPAPGPAACGSSSSGHVARAVPSLRLLRNAGATENMSGLLRRLSRGDRGRGGGRRGRSRGATSSRRQRSGGRKSRTWQHAHHPPRSDDWLGLPPREGRAERDVRARGRAPSAAGLARRRADSGPDWRRAHPAASPPPHGGAPSLAVGDGDLLDLTPRSGGTPLAGASSQNSTPWSWQEATEAAEAAGAATRVRPAVEEAPGWQPAPSTASQEWWRRHAEKYNRAPPPGSQPAAGPVRRPSLSLNLLPEGNAPRRASMPPHRGDAAVRGRWRKAIVAAAAVARFEGGRRRRKSSQASPTEAAAVRTYQRRPTSVARRRSSTFSLQQLMEAEGRPTSRSSAPRSPSPASGAALTSPLPHSAARGGEAASGDTSGRLLTHHTPESGAGERKTGGQDA